MNSERKRTVGYVEELRREVLEIAGVDPSTTPLSSLTIEIIPHNDGDLPTILVMATDVTTSDEGGMVAIPGKLLSLESFGVTPDEPINVTEYNEHIHGVLAVNIGVLSDKIGWEEGKAEFVSELLRSEWIDICGRASGFKREAAKAESEDTVH